MVFYTCSGCGESLKKNKVENHLYTCKYCEYLTCIDCSNDFYGDDYKKHTSCITEDQKYSAKGTEFKPNKGDLKQQQWLQRIDEVVSSKDSPLSKRAKDLLTNLKHYDNIPRKRAKFLNFLKNSLRIFDVKLGEEVWEAFSNTSPKSSDNTASAAPKSDKTAAKSADTTEAGEGEQNMENTACEGFVKERTKKKAKKRKIENETDGESKKRKQKDTVVSDAITGSEEGASEKEPATAKKPKKKKKVKDKKRTNETPINGEKDEQLEKQKFSELNNNQTDHETMNGDHKEPKKKKVSTGEEDIEKNEPKSKHTSENTVSETKVEPEPQSPHENGGQVEDGQDSCAKRKKKKKSKNKKTPDEPGFRLCTIQPEADTTNETPVKRKKKSKSKSKQEPSSLTENGEVNPNKAKIVVINEPPADKIRKKKKSKKRN